MQFTPCQLPSNQYAFTGHIYLNPADFEQIQTIGNVRKVTKSDILVKANGFILKVEPLDAIERGYFGASSFHREMLQVSKLDKILISLAEVSELNPLSELNLTIEYKLLQRNQAMEFEDDGMILKLTEEMI